MVKRERERGMGCGRVGVKSPAPIHTKNAHVNGTLVTLGIISQSKYRDYKILRAVYVSTTARGNAVVLLVACKASHFGVGDSKMTKPSPFPSLLVQEFRNLLSVICRETCMTDKAGGESAAGQQVLQEKVFHGSAGYASVLTNCLQGKGDAASMFNRIPIENNREGNEEREGSHMLQLLDIFSCDEGNWRAKLSIVLA
jgi:hypothetical protein